MFAVRSLSSVVGDVLNGRANIDNPYVRRAVDYDLGIWTPSMYRVLFRYLDIDNPSLYTNDEGETKRRLKDHLIAYMEGLPSSRQTYIPTYANVPERRHYNTNRDRALDHILTWLDRRRGEVLDPLDANERQEFYRDFETLSNDDVALLAEQEGIFPRDSREEIEDGLLNKINGFPYDFSDYFSEQSLHDHSSNYDRLLLQQYLENPKNPLDTETLRRIPLEEFRSWLENEVHQNLSDKTPNQLVQLYLNQVYTYYLFQQERLYHQIYNQMILRSPLSAQEAFALSLSIASLSLKNLRRLADKFGLVVSEGSNYNATKRVYMRAISSYIRSPSSDRNVKLP